MIYTAIKTLEKRWPLFNREPFTKAHCLKLLEEMGVIPVADRQVPEAMALCHGKKALVVYNPHLSDSDLVLNIGHELGHFALGHIKSTRRPILSRIFSKTTEEKDAGIIGFLMWAPTPELCRICDKGRLNIEELYHYDNSGTETSRRTRRCGCTTTESRSSTACSGPSGSSGCRCNSACRRNLAFEQGRGRICLIIC